MEHYEKECHFINREFWTKLGYQYGNVPPHLPSSEDNKVKYRWQKCPPCIQCDRCLKWRELTFNSRILEKGFPKPEWECEHNWDDNFNRHAIFLLLIRLEYIN